MLCPEDRRPLPGGAVHFLSPLSPPLAGWGRERPNFRDLAPVWERKGQGVNRDALTRLKTPRGVGGFQIDSIIPGGDLINLRNLSRRIAWLMFKNNLKKKLAANG